MTEPGSAGALGGLAEILIEESLDGVVVIDPRGQIVAFNRAAGQIFGLDPAGMMGQSLERLFVPGVFVEHQRYIEEYLRGEGRGVVGSIIEVEGWHSSGKPIPLEIGLSEARSGEQRLFIAWIRDITRRREDSEQQRAMRELVMRAQRIESLGTLSAGVAHDFGNTLGAIMGYASTLIAELPRDHHHYADVAQILALAHRAHRLAGGLLSMSVAPEAARELCNLNRVVRNVVAVLRRSIPRKVSVKLRLAPTVYVEGDPAQLEQCVMNLCLNAKDAMPDGGELILETRCRELDQAEVASLKREAGRCSVLAVRDNGIGMDATTVARVFQPFFSTKPRGSGTGLGLSVVLGIVEAHGGSVQVQSELGQGTEVRLYLPAVDGAEELRRPPATRPGRQRSRGETILVVDDERSLRNMLRRLLESLGYQVLLAQSGEEALSVYRAQQAEIDLVLLDLVLQDMDGPQALEALLEVNPDVRVLISSGLVRGDEPARLKAQGACGFLPKPYDIDEVSEAVSKALNGGAAG